MKPRDQGGKIVSVIDDDAVLAIALTTLRGFERPLKVTRAQFDAAITAQDLPGYPSAKGLLRRFPDFTWDDLRELADDDPADEEAEHTPAAAPAPAEPEPVSPAPDARLGRLTTAARHPIRLPTLQQVLDALRVAGRLAPGEPMRQRVYLYARDRARPADVQWMPSLDALRDAIRRHDLTWRLAVTAAGLDAGGPRDERRPGLPAADAIDMYVADLAVLPTTEHLRRWTRARGLRIQGSLTRPVFEAGLREYRRRCEQDGTPIAPKATRQPDLTGLGPVSPAHPGARRKMPATVDEIVDRLVIALDRLPAGERLSEDQLTLLSHQDPALIPSPDHVARIATDHGIQRPLPTLRHLAAVRRLHRDAGRPHPPLHYTPSRDHIDARLRTALDGRKVWPTDAEWQQMGQMPLRNLARRRGGTRYWCRRLDLAHPSGRINDEHAEALLHRELRAYLDGKPAWPPRSVWRRDGQEALLDRALIAGGGHGPAHWARRLGVHYDEPTLWNDTAIDDGLRDFKAAGHTAWPSQAAARRLGYARLFEAARQSDLRMLGWADRVGLTLTSGQRRRALADQDADWDDDAYCIRRIHALAAGGTDFPTALELKQGGCSGLLRRMTRRNESAGDWAARTGLTWRAAPRDEEMLERGLVALKASGHTQWPSRHAPTLTKAQRALIQAAARSDLGTVGWSDRVGLPMTPQQRRQALADKTADWDDDTYCEQRIRDAARRAGSPYFPTGKQLKDAACSGFLRRMTRRGETARQWADRLEMPMAPVGRPAATRKGKDERPGR